jgi:hypothetical protein
MANKDIPKELLNNGKSVFSEIFQFRFFIKLIILFILYLISNLIFDKINEDELKRIFENNPTLTIELPNNIIFKLLITLIMIITSNFIYLMFIKPLIKKN